MMNNVQQIHQVDETRIIQYHKEFLSFLKQVYSRLV
jgi:hypothetical protein